MALQPHVKLSEVQAWVEDTRLAVTDIDDALEDTATTLVFAELNNIYDTSTWIDAYYTPPIVRKIIAMFIVAWMYQRTYSDDSDQSTYGTWLEKKANTLLLALVTKTTPIPGVDTTEEQSIAQADFYPNDGLDEWGCPTEPYFTMSQRF